MNIESDEEPCFILKEYLKHHNKYTNIYGDKTIVLMMVGQFYEIYGVINDKMNIGPNLNELSDILNIQIARRNKKIKEINYDNFLMMGFPDHSLFKFRNILLNNGYTIIKVDQVTAKPNPERAVTEIISPSTVIDTYNKSDTNYLLSIYIDSHIINNINDKIFTSGISVIDVSTGTNHVHSIVSNKDDKKIWSDEIYRLIQYYNPSEIIIHYNTDKFNYNKGKLSLLWNINENNIHINLINSKEYFKISYQNLFLSKYFQSDNNLSTIEYLGFEREPEIILSYIFMLQFVYEHKIENTLSLHKPQFKQNKNHLLLSHNCVEQLNIIDNKTSTVDKCSSLLSILNKCSTAIGRRLCKERILYPILDVKDLKKRYELIDFFQNKLKEEYLYDFCIPYLKKIVDVEKLHRKMGIQLLHPYEFNSMNNSYLFLLKIIEKLNEIPEYFKYIDNFNNIEKSINDYINDYLLIFNIDELEKWSLQNIETSLFNKSIFPEIDELDNSILINKKYLQIISNKLAFYIDKKKEDLIKISSSDKYGWHLYMTKNRSQILKKNLNNLINSKIDFKYNNKIFFSCDVKDIHFVQKGSNYHISLNRINEISDTIISLQKKLQSLNHEKYIEKIKYYYHKYNEIMKNIVNYIGIIDLNTNIAKISIENSYNKPEIVEDKNSYIDAKCIRHPIVETIQTETEYISNDIKLNEDGILLYGTNACGKSTLMKSLGLSIIMAQSGFFVPCSYFKYSPYTQIFTRILNNDNLFQGQSSFAVEMNELRSILLRANHKSLVLGDELCSGTENTSALAIVGAGLKTLSNIKCSFMFTSHLHQLMDLEIVKNISNLSIFHLKIIYDQEKDLLIYDRKLENGSGPAIYGLEVCKAMGLNKDFISLARSVQLEITGSDKNLIIDKKSNYNPGIFMDKCQVCLQKSEHTHHIKEQHTADKNNIIDFHHKNIKHNLVPLCESCHYKVHNENLKIKGYKLTNKGVILDYEYSDKHLENNKKNKKKFNSSQIIIIKEYYHKFKNKQNCINKLELNENIKISIQTFNKIINHNY